MKQQLKHIPAYLLGLVFVVFGSDFFIHFMPTPPQMAGDAGTFAGILYSSGYLKVIKILEVTIGLLLFVPKTRAIALLLIAPIVVNILLFELYLVHQPGIGVALTIINAIGIYLNREKYMSIVS